MSSKKRKRSDKDTKNSDKKSDEKEKDKRGRKPKNLDEEVKKKISEEVLKEMKETYLKENDLNEKDFIPYSQDIITDNTIQLNKELSGMIKVYIYNLYQDDNNEIYKEINFSKKLKKIISFLNMSENEFSFFTILVDLIGLKLKKNFDTFEHLYYIGILSLQYSSGKFMNNIDDKFIQWKIEINNDNNEIKEKIEKIGIREINTKREELILHDNGYDQDKYIDYNQLVDDILNSAHFYKDRKESME